MRIIFGSEHMRTLAAAKREVVIAKRRLSVAQESVTLARDDLAVAEKHVNDVWAAIDEATA